MPEFKPMLACKLSDPAKLRFPAYVQPKLDGIRCSIVNERPVTRTLKGIPNASIREALSRPEFEGLDGELIVGDPTASDCYRRTSSFVMAENKTGEPWCFFVFDKHDDPRGFAERYVDLIGAYPSQAVGSGHIQLVPTATVEDADELAAVEASLVEQGHEGAVLRGPHTRYKFGRASMTGGELIKLKRFEDAEAVIVGVYEEQHNGNVAVRNALGRTERSTAQAGKTGKGTLGGFFVRDCETGIEFKVGTGFSAAERQDYWNRQDELSDDIIKYKSFKIGVKEKPRHPVFLGFRDRRDM